MKTVTVFGGVDAMRIDRLNLTVQVAGLVLAVDRLGTRQDFCRVDHVRRTARMHDAARIGQVLHQQSRAPGMIKMDMREKNEIDVADVQSVVLKPGE